jgi:hypothetical protein
LRINYKTILFLVVLLAFAAGLVRLFALRFSAGDVYPPYSSLRSDPLGTKVLYESLGGLPGIDTERNYGDEDRIAGAERATFFYFGLKAHMLSAMQERDVNALERIASGGGRLVFCLFPGAGPSVRRGDDGDAEDTETSAGPKQPDGKEESAKAEKPEPEKKKEKNVLRVVDLRKRWQFDLDRAASGSPPVALPAAGFAPIMPSGVLTWHADSYLAGEGGVWTPVFTRNGRIVMAERKFGRGSIVIATDSFFASNEAMAGERHPELLAWLAGANRKIVFDETHLGIRENKGVVSLFRKYRLEGLGAAVLVLGLLFIWKNAFSLVPVAAGRDHGKEDEAAPGRDYISGFAGILRRTVAPSALLATCLEEWERTAGTGRLRGADKRERIGTLIRAQQGQRPGEEKIVAVYRAAAKILAERKTHD